MGPGIDFLCKLYCQDSQCHVDIHLFGLEMRNIFIVKRLFILARLSLNLTRYTSAVGISCKSWWTFTVGPMVVYSALSTSPTWIINAAGVNTSSISAGLTGCTFIIT